MDPTPSVDQELEAIRRGNQRRRLILAGVIVVLGAGTLVQDFAAALAWAPPAIGRSLLGALGSAAGVLLWRQPRTGWPLALAWAAIQVPFYARTPDGGSPTAQWLQFPLTMTESLRQNGQLVRYSSMGVNLVGVVLVMWLRWWRDLLVPGAHESAIRVAGSSRLITTRAGHRLVRIGAPRDCVRLTAVALWARHSPLTGRRGGATPR